MSEDKFDAIVVGGGLAGTAAAYTLAKAGLEVLLLERGQFCGAKNVSGGRLYTHSLAKLMPEFEKTAPLERKITKERVSFMTETEATTLEYKMDSSAAPERASYSVLRKGFDKWMADQAEEAGAMIVSGFRVDELLKENGKITGVRCGDEVMLSDVVILADGVNSLLAQRAGLKDELDAKEVAVGVKEVIQFDEKTINERFGLEKDEGTAWMMVGDVTDGTMGGAFLYTNKDTISIGIVATIDDIGHSEVSVPDMVERTKNHPVIRPLLDGGRLVEYSAHLVTEGGYQMMPKLYDDGVLIAGDAAAMVINLGYTVRGMDFAIESGRLAAEAVLLAKDKNDFSAESLSAYKKLLDDSFVLKDLKHYQAFPEFMGSSHRIYESYAKILNHLMSGVFTVDGNNSEDLLMTAAKGISKVGLVNLALDGVNGLGALL